MSLVRDVMSDHSKRVCMLYWDNHVVIYTKVILSATNLDWCLCPRLSQGMYTIFTKIKNKNYAIVTLKKKDYVLKATSN